jgi:hypothetical protein
MEDGRISDETVQKISHVMDLYYRSANPQDVGADLDGAELRIFNLCKKLHKEVSSILRTQREETERMKRMISAYAPLKRTQQNKRETGGFNRTGYPYQRPNRSDKRSDYHQGVQERRQQDPKPRSTNEGKTTRNQRRNARH